MKKLAAVLLITMTLTAGCSRPAPERNYVNSEHKFRMNMPDGWTAADAGNEEPVVALGESVVVLRIPPSTETGEAFISVRILDNLEDSNPRKLYDKQFSVLKKELEDFKVEERDEKFEATGEGAYLITCNFKHEDALWSGTILYVTYGGRGAVVLCACFASDYSAYKGSFLSTCKSFFLE